MVTQSNELRPNLNEDDRNRLFERYGRRYAMGQEIFSEGQTSDMCFLLQEGRVRLLKRVRSAERSLCVIRPGELFGEDALLKNSVRSTAAVALTDIAALVLDRDTFSMLLSSNPNVGYRLLEQLVSRLRDAEEQLENTMLRDHPSRVVNTLLRLASSSHSSATTDGIDISPLDLSSRVGLDVEAVKRVMQNLRDGGYVQIFHERIVINDLEALRRLYELLGVKEEVRG